MNAEELKALQAPIKDRYRNDPGAAVVTLRARGARRRRHRLPRRHRQGAWSRPGCIRPPAAAALQACSGDMLLEALVACAGVTLKAVATALGIDLRDAKVHAPKATSTSAARSAWRRTRRSASARSACASTSTPTRRAEQKTKLIELTERYCVVLQTIRKAPPVASGLMRA